VDSVKSLTPSQGLGAGGGGIRLPAWANFRPTYA